PGNAEGVGTHPPRSADERRATPGLTPAESSAPGAAPAAGPTPVVSRLLRRRALARVAREERARPVLTSRSAVPVAAAPVDAMSGGASLAPATATATPAPAPARESAVRRSGPGRTLRPLAGPVRRATRGHSAPAPLSG